MSIRVTTAKLRRVEHKTTGTAAIVVLAAAAFAANIAAAAASNHRHSRAPMPKNSWSGHYAPSDYGRYDLGVSTQSGAGPETGHGAFEERIGGP